MSEPDATTGNGLRAVMAEVLGQWASPRTAREAADALLAPVHEAAIAELRHLGYLAIPVDLLDSNDLLPPDESPLPNRHHVPVGDAPQRNVRTPQPVTDDSQPVTEGVPTGTRYRLPNPDLSLDQTHYQREEQLRDATTEGEDDGFDDFDSLSKVIRLSERRRRGA